MIDHRTVAMLIELFGNQKVHLYELSIQTGINKESLLTGIQQVNDLLTEHQFETILLDQDICNVPESLIKQQEQVFELLKSRDIYLTQDERQILIYLYTFIRKDFISNIHYQELLSVSRNTTLTDIKNVRELCQRFHLSFDYTRSQGYHLAGDEKDKHRLALYAISRCLKSPIGAWALDYVLRSWQEKNQITVLKEVSRQFCQFYQYTVLEERLDEYLYFLQFLFVRRKRVDLVVPVTEESNYPMMEKMVSRLWSNLPSNTSLPREMTPYLASLLQGCLEGDVEHEHSFFADLTLKIVEEMERLSLITFENRSELLEGLQRHLIPAYYRLSAKVETINTYTEVIKEEHKELFEFVKKALRPLEEQIGYEVPDSEVSYFVIHFGGYIESAQHRQFRYKALVLCPNGVSSSLILKENLKQLFPNIYFSDEHSLANVGSISQKGYDMVFSTVRFETSLPFFLVPAILSASQKRDLFHLVHETFSNASQVPIEIEQMIAVIGKYATIHKEKTLKYELAQFLNEITYERKEKIPMLDELITKETYQYTEEKLSWQDAIALSAKPLLESGAVEDTYIEAMVNKVEEFGAFIDLGKGVAIPHARPEDGVNRVGMAMLNLKEPIYLLDDPTHEIRLLICIAAVDNQTHLKALSHLTGILRDATSVQQLIEARCFDDIANLIKEEQ